MKKIILVVLFLPLIIAAQISYTTEELDDSIATTQAIEAIDGLIEGDGAGAYTEVDTAAELEAAAGLGAFFSDYADDADAATMRTTLGLVIDTDVEPKVTEGSLDDDVIVSADIDDGTITASDLNDTQNWSGKTITMAPPEIDTLEAADLDDTTDPHTLISTELRYANLSNADSVGADEWDFAAHTTNQKWNFCFFKVVDQNVTLDPNGTEQWYYRTDNSVFTQLSAGEALVNTTAGKSCICCTSVATDVYCNGDANWSEETP